jgi:hypothetical protein
MLFLFGLLRLFFTFYGLFYLSPKMLLGSSD